MKNILEKYQILIGFILAGLIIGISYYIKNNVNYNYSNKNIIGQALSLVGFDPTPTPVIDSGGTRDMPIKILRTTNPYYLLGIMANGEIRFKNNYGPYWQKFNELETYGTFDDFIKAFTRCYVRVPEPIMTTANASDDAGWHGGGGAWYKVTIKVENNSAQTMYENPIQTAPVIEHLIPDSPSP